MEKEEPPGLAALFFDNPKTNLTYEKNLCTVKFQISCQTLCKYKQVNWYKKIFCKPELTINKNLIMC